MVRIRLLVLLALSLLVFGTTSGQESRSEVDDEPLEGEALAIRYCSSCHQFPDASLLPKKSWEFLLTYMGFFLGVVDYSYLDGSPERVMESIGLREEFLRTAKLLPENPIISNAQWTRLREYYQSEAPKAALPQLAKPDLIESSQLFSVRQSQYSIETPITSMVHIDEANGLLFIHDSRAERLTILDKKLRIHGSHPSPNVSLVEASTNDESVYLLSIGDLFAANIGEKFGELQQAGLVGGILFNLKVVLEGLHRPSDFSLVDLENDGSLEALICNFGDYTGDFSIYRKDEATDTFLSEPQVLSVQAGIVKSEAFDFTGDGLLDIVLLSSGGRENLSLFVNEGDGSFIRKLIVEQHPSFGYTGLELRDFNGDGLMDLLTVNGDNGDSDPYNTLKRDHGIRIYLNRGDLNFEETYFYPMYGAYGAEVEDFDLDGDYDIAAISFHPDFNQEKIENFVYLEQGPGLVFSAKTHPATYNGRWLTIDSGDLDGDGDKDLVLGAALLPVGMSAEQQEALGKVFAESSPVLFLENQTRTR